MSMDRLKFNRSDFAGQDITSLPDSPSAMGVSASELKARFDNIPKIMIALGKHNELIDALSAADGADNIGAKEHEDIKAGTVGGALNEIADKRVAFKTQSAKYIRVNGDKVLETSSDGENWQATGSSGHVIYDKDGNEMPQRARMRFTDSEITDDGTSTIIRGVKGDAGPQGVQGPQGPQGIQGPQGNKGDKGDVGAVGPQGEKGDTGDPGPQGIQGPKGDAGATGPRGEKGDAGAEGPQGPAGPQGPRGLTGADGKSFKVIALYATLYDLQVAHPTGTAGDAYGVGSAANNTIYIWDTDKGEWTDIGALQGPQGIQGPIGATGAQGPKGEKGDVGVAGPQGLKGDAGPQGIQGPKGDKGDTGATGAQGPKGDKGDTGLQGAQGPQGIQGDTGAQGSQGPKGDTGPQGTPGQGVARGGAAGQALVKVSALDYDTVWSDTVPDAGKLGGQPPAYYAPIESPDFKGQPSAGSFATNANGGSFWLKGDGYWLRMHYSGSVLHFYKYDADKKTILGDPFAIDGNGRMTVNGLLYCLGNIEGQGGTFHGMIKVNNGMGIDQDAGGVLKLVGNGGVAVKTTANAFTIITASFFNTSSSARFKDILGAMEYERARKVLDAELIQFKYKKNFSGDDDIHYGVKAEQIDEIGLGDVVCYDADGRPTGVDYSKFVPYLIGVAQEQNRTIEELKARIETLEAKSM